MSQNEAEYRKYLAQFEGRTVVDVDFEGASASTLPAVKSAVLMHSGDTFSVAVSVPSIHSISELLQDNSIPSSTKQLLIESERQLNTPSLQSPKERKYSNGNLQSVYNFDPLSNVYGSSVSSITDDKKKHVLGGQGNLWTERLPTQQRRFYNTNPRLAGLSEALWSPSTVKDFEDFRRRLGSYLAPRYTIMGIDYNPKSVPKTSDQ